MMYRKLILATLVCLFSLQSMNAQIGQRFPSERKVVIDSVTGTELVFLTSTPGGDRKIYPTHNQWTSDGEWLIFRSKRVEGEAMAVHEKTGVLVQVTEGGYKGMLNIARNSMHLYMMRKPLSEREDNALEIVEVDLATLFSDSEQGLLKAASTYQRVCGITPSEISAGGDMALDASEDWVWFRVGKDEAAKHLPESVDLEPNFGPRNMGAGPGGIAGMNIHTGEMKHVVSVPFQVGHIQTNPWVPGQIIFCWETGGKAPQRTWIVNSDGSGLRPLYPEANFEWVTHEAVIGPNEVAMAIMGHRKIKLEKDENGTASAKSPGMEKEWGECGTREKPSGLAIVNIQSREMTIAGQIPFGSGFWHVHGSSDGRFACGDDFDRNLYLINRESNEMLLLTTGHKRTAKDHVHPTFSPDGRKIQIQSALLSEDNESLNICIVPVPEAWLKDNE